MWQAKKREGEGEGEGEREKSVKGYPQSPSLFSQTLTPSPFDPCYTGYREGCKTSFGLHTFSIKMKLYGTSSSLEKADTFTTTSDGSNKFNLYSKITSSAKGMPSRKT